MRNLYIDPATGDITTTVQGNLRLTTTLSEYVSQKIENNLKTFKEEWFLNPDLGLPYFNRILIKNADLDDINTLFSAEISKITEVEEIISFETDYDNVKRKYFITYQVRITGETDPLEGEVTI